ncbi:2'-5'-oligoadenylate synthase 2 [Echinops telfairi]|uniref:2'-5'-oligoadenylate synthase 2 n=1 Tax=Echinops telfairi TaxID=9371 RepID=A0AC55DLL0_ECHTE|nr:2'-5'-oligoadenylate synthase 2 [Echinops telfairi]
MDKVKVVEKEKWKLKAQEGCGMRDGAGEDRKKAYEWLTAKRVVCSPQQQQQLQQQEAMWGWCSHSKVNSIPAQALGPFIQSSLRLPEDSRTQIDQAVNAICAVLQDCPQQPVVGGVAKLSKRIKGREEDDQLSVLGIWASKRSRTWHPINERALLASRMSASHDYFYPLKAALWFCNSKEWDSGPGEKPSAQIYRELKSFLDTTLSRPSDFSVCFMTLQEEFFKNRPRKLKDLILLVKYWYQQCQEKRRDPGKLPAYALELLTVYAWEQGCGQDDFELAEGIRTVLWLITQHKKLCVYWTVNYNFENETMKNILLYQLRAPRPVILDPVNPMHNLSGGPDKCWEWLDQEARVWLSFLRPDDGFPGPFWNVLPAPLYITPDHLLDKFIQDFLQPSKEFLDQVKKAVDIICSFLKEKCFQTSVDRIKIQKIVKVMKVEISKWCAPRVLSFSLRSKELPESVEFDLLPAFNALGLWTPGSTPSPTVYAELIRLFDSSKYVKGEFSCCFTELQRDFIISRPTKVKSLIRLVKHWYKQCERKLKTKRDPTHKVSLPPKYALELLTIYAWEQGSGEVDFNTARGFQTVLELVTQYQQLCIFWTVNYNFQDPTVGNFLWRQIRNTRPVILDPADPTGDVGRGDSWDWHLLAQEAKEWLSSSLCFKDGAGSTGTPWRVPLVQTPGSCGARIQSIAHFHPEAIMSWASTARRHF